MAQSNLRLIRDFRNYLIELQKSGKLSSKEIEILRYTYGNVFNKLIVRTDNKNINNCTLKKSDIVIILQNLDNILSDTTDTGKALKQDLQKLHDELFLE